MYNHMNQFMMVPDMLVILECGYFELISSHNLSGTHQSRRNRMIVVSVCTPSCDLLNDGRAPLLLIITRDFPSEDGERLEDVSNIA